MPMSYRSSIRIAPSTSGRYYSVTPSSGRVLTSSSHISKSSKSNSISGSNINSMGFTSSQDNLIIGQSPRRLVINKTTHSESSWVTLRPSLQTAKADFILEQQPTIDHTNLVKDATNDITENNR